MGRKAKASDDVVYWNEYGIVQAMEKHPAGKAKETPAHLKFMDGDSPKQTEYTQGFYKGAIYERKRIIKLLEEQIALAEKNYESAPNTYVGQQEKESAYFEIRQARWAIALIKGENK